MLKFDNWLIKDTIESPYVGIWDWNWDRGMKLEYLSLIFDWMIRNADKDEVKRVCLDMSKMPIFIGQQFILSFNESTENIKKYLMIFFEKLSNTVDFKHLDGVYMCVMTFEKNIKA